MDDLDVDSTDSRDSTQAVDSKVFSNSRLMAGVAWSKGDRVYMQDAFNITLDAYSKDLDVDFLGVFDGHGPGGEKISRCIAYKLCNLVLERHQDDEGDLTLEEAIEAGCYELDEAMREDDNLDVDDDGLVSGGSTCCCVWIMREEIYSCNIGDSRFIMSYQGQPTEITHDHKPTDRKEKRRILRAGGFIHDMRVNDVLSVSRCFADFSFKEQDNLHPDEQLVVCTPDIKIVAVDDDVDFLIIATDGLWDVWQNHEAVDFVYELMEEDMALNKICEQLIEQSFQEFIDDPGLGDSDNITVIVVLFR